MNLENVERLIRELLVEIGEDPDREGLTKTPLRVAKSYEFLTSGYRTDISKIINNAVFESHANNMIIARDIEVYSMCEHHMLPFFGRCHIGYIAKKKVIGVSKLARIVDYFGRRLQIQERLTAQIAREVKETVDALGVGVVVECKHLCMMMRGVEKQNSVMTTSTVLGVSKLARIVDVYARRLQIQERLTAQIARQIMATAKAEGVGVG
ncbi:MAG: GTP cyclohydrolase I FolE, partial [Spirochaetaceae bacterium]